MAEHKDRTSFTLRFEDEGTHEALRLVADHYGMSMNRLAQEMLSRELRAAVLIVEKDLSETLQAVRAYRGEGLDEDLAAFAEAEVTEEDPIQTQMEILTMADSLGISRIFA